MNRKSAAPKLHQAGQQAATLKATISNILCPKKKAA
jgi:hypothetical protein